MRSTLLLSLVLGARLAAASTSYLLPLYFWPNEDGTCWSDVTSVAAAHPDLSWVIIINPESGPSTVSAIQPILDCIPQLRSAIPSAKLVGYVSTRYGERASSDVEADIDTYATWGTVKTTNGSLVGLLDGLFADEMSSDGSDVSLYASYASYARDKLGDLVVMNPGTSADAGYYETADLIVSYESSCEDWSKQAIMIYGLPEGDTSTVSSLLDTLVTKDQVGAVWLSDLTLDVNIYGSLSSDFAAVISGVDQRNSAISTTTTSKGAASTTASSSVASTSSASRTSTRILTSSTTTSKKASKTSSRKHKYTRRVHHH
ncbi:Spherulation-specific family 4-domain-containing protein [Leucosporidium creatinivorum]|uniref:Spherulation-specific family 4-domain-containing protein n=1 Tax=Leucosporidium creatinivorum TaxID=106004 RepID=A0A1Y2FD48_9BASI|nr:Spherulation-specific family 4-domain-containing protein [Leucosporidium creatinivorum]